MATSPDPENHSEKHHALHNAADGFEKRLGAAAAVGLLVAAKKAWDVYQEKKKA